MTPVKVLITYNYTYYRKRPKVGNPIASIFKSNAQIIPTLCILNPVSNFLGFALNPKPLNPKP